MDALAGLGASPESTPRRRASRWVWWAAGLVLAVVVAIIAAQVWPGRGTTGPSAAESRDQLNAVLTDTFARLGVEPEREPDSGIPLTCGLPGGGEGESYFLDTLNGAAPEDIEDAAADVRAMWEDLGFVVTERNIAPTLVLSARTPDGGGVYLFVDKERTTANGESACGEPSDLEGR